MQGCPNQAQANHFLPQDLSQDLSQGISQGFCPSGHSLDSIARACEHAAREYLARRGPGVYMSLLHVGAVQAICESVPVVQTRCTFVSRGLEDDARQRAARWLDAYVDAALDGVPNLEVAVLRSCDAIQPNVGAGSALYC